MLLAVMLLVVTNGIIVGAAYDEGSYNGYAFNATLNATTSVVSGSMNYQGGTKIRIEGTGYYVSASGIATSTNLITDRQVSSVTLWKPVPSGSFTMANCDFKVGATTVANLTVYP